MERLVHFSGDWTPSEQAAIGPAIKRCESRIEADLSPNSMGRPWIGVKECVGGACHYVARRDNVERTFEGKSISQLRKQLVRAERP